LFCENELIPCYLPFHKKYAKIDRKLYFNDVVVNVAGKFPGIVIRHSDFFRTGELNGIIQLKIKMLGKVKILSSLEWANTRTNDYFKNILYDKN
jgi:hypothetical protein